ncbi:HAD family phosphatase [Paraclostridium ghonii]|uniref:HAD superfamily hydrolase (TIGR01509 family) n=1 Tax=Paraclostridium ghonii TaxID=29358 RepID=A0ABU0MYI7_9FIRM|nr:HAD family phosphatase [Paeniclostridium ghonii]MDQ0555975.1 HAD superfamily hydrolase (TIGR01509 family) [Paeniclostridium ghonii]
MKRLGIIFDFNGTLFWDSDKHENAWKNFSKKLRGNALSDEEMKKIVHGRTNKFVIEYLLDSSVDDNQVALLAEEKEAFYRTACKRDITNFRLAPGAIEFLDFLKEHKIPFTIATASGEKNLKFFFKEFNLSKWFDFSNVIYDDGSILGKPEPDIYLKAAATIGVKPEDCIVIEDAISGIESAYRANIGKIIAITPRDTHEYFLNLKGVDFVINDFNEFNRGLLL